MHSAEISTALFTAFTVIGQQVGFNTKKIAYYPYGIVVQFPCSSTDWITTSLDWCKCGINKNSLLPTNQITDLRGRSVGVPGPTWVICAHPYHQMGKTPVHPYSRSLLCLCLVLGSINRILLVQIRRLNSPIHTNVHYPKQGWVTSPDQITYTLLFLLLFLL